MVEIERVNHGGRNGRKFRAVREALNTISHSLATGVTTAEVISASSIASQRSGHNLWNILNTFMVHREERSRYSRRVPIIVWLMSP